MTEQAPIRCPSCEGSGEGRTVMTGDGPYSEPCALCSGAGQRLRPGTTAAALVRTAVASGRSLFATQPLLVRRKRRGLEA
ncbi:hypothetical protein [Streptomyces marispadix]|uniref:Molecular chaperone DnaJ n=1 Tax=Streptomyces marispadix TaxID=2922868 RepID=A0ABS9SSU8_9ACTN|nr:hypothetical protein [Streptomyces marispadix]MCH6159341.1 hypothetical protein [Streptomyces marispadix]